MERIRELFDQAILKSPASSKKDLYLMYAHLEEKRGLSRHVVRIYDEAVEKVSADHQPDMYRVYIKKVIQLFGVTRAREIYEKAIQVIKNTGFGFVPPRGDFVPPTEICPPAGGTKSAQKNRKGDN